MNLTNSQRAMLLARDLCAQPRNIPRYFFKSLLTRHKPAQFGLPWFSWAAIDFLENFLKPQMDAFEWGSGGSTLFLARRCRSVCSIEDDPQWLPVVKCAIANANLKNVEIRHYPFDFRNPVNFENSEYLNAIGQAQYDVIIVDGQDWTTNERPLCFARAEQNIKKGGIIVVDDSWRYTCLREKNRALRWQVFQSVGPCRIGVTSTNVYFY